MEGRGVVNYDAGKTSYAFSTETTEFDDELIRRGIVTFEQAMQAKGATFEEALRLKAVKYGDTADATTADNKNEDGNVKSGEDDDHDEKFLEQFRKQRLAEIKELSKQPHFGSVIPISRPEWNHQVNDASHKSWVVVNLTSSDSERTGCVENAVQTLAAKYPRVKFVAIPYRSAIANWPESNLPSLFLYRHGSMQHQMVQISMVMSADQLEWKLAEQDVLETGLIEEPRDQPNKSTTSSRYGVFGGKMSRLSTQGSGEDYDDVD